METNLARLAEATLTAWVTIRRCGSTASGTRPATCTTGPPGSPVACATSGVRPGDRVVVVMANCPEVTISYSAIWRAGAVVTPVIFLVSTAPNFTTSCSTPALWPWSPPRSSCRR